MDFKLVSESSFEYGCISKYVNDISQELGVYFQEKSYGKDISLMVISVITVSEEFDPFILPHKPKFSKSKHIFIDHGVEIDGSNSLTFSIKISHERLNQISNKNKFFKEFQIELNKNLSIFNTIEVSDFNVASFEQDLNSFFDNV